MSNYQATDVYNYLCYLEHYLIGDLETFHKVCEKAEKGVNASASAVTASNAGSMYAEPPQYTSSPTIIETTMYPGSTSSHYFSLKSNTEDQFRLTIPITLTLFATVDCVGYLSGANSDPLKTNENFKEFFKQSRIPVTEADSVFLNQVFRQGLTHVYFPKLNLGISYYSDNPPEKLFFKDDSGNLVLNVNRLEAIVIDTFKNIKENENLYPTMSRRYQSLIADYQARYGITIANYAV